MKTLIEILTALPVGEVVPKSALAIFKRIGKITDYSHHGYLESGYVYYISSYDGKKDYYHTHSGRLPKDGEPGSYENPFPSFEAMVKAGYSECVDFEYKGFSFHSKYFDGCFCPYLIKKSGPTIKNTKVNRSICLWGAVI